MMARVAAMQRPVQLADTCTSIHQYSTSTTNVLLKPHKDVSKPRWLNGLGRGDRPVIESHTATLFDTPRCFSIVPTCYKSA
jgi:hypothetical protein